jgi:hypothetical protein
VKAKAKAKTTRGKHRRKGTHGHAMRTKKTKKPHTTTQRRRKFVCGGSGNPMSPAQFNRIMQQVQKRQRQHP